MAAEEKSSHPVEAEPPPPGAAGAKKMGTRGAKKMGTRMVATPPVSPDVDAHVPSWSLPEEEEEEPFCFLPSGEPADEEETKARTAAPAAEDDEAPRLLAIEPVPWLLPPPAAKGKTEARIATRARAPRRVCGWLPRPFFSSSFPRRDGFERLDENPFR